MPFSGMIKLKLVSYILLKLNVLKVCRKESLKSINFIFLSFQNFLKNKNKEKRLYNTKLFQQQEEGKRRKKKKKKKEKIKRKLMKTAIGILRISNILCSIICYLYIYVIYISYFIFIIHHDNWFIGL